MRLWRHAIQVQAQRVLVYSPDTDVYNIGVPIVDQCSQKEVIVQINVAKSRELKYLHINNLVRALQDDPDCGTLPRDKLTRIFLVLFVSSGCDFISYFSGYGKGGFLNTFYQHASFITGKQSYGHLSDTSEEGFYSFLRLIGCLYFKKYYSAIVSIRGIDTPQQLLQSFPSSSLGDQHTQWYNAIRSIVSDRISNEEERMPTKTSMWRHWQRSSWISSMWYSSTEEDPYIKLPLPENSGWRKTENEVYTFDWDCPEVMSKVQDTINFLTKGCSCKKGCGSQRCGCKKKGTHCGPSCQCLNCNNISDRNIEESSADISDTDSEDSENELDPELGEEA